MVKIPVALRHLVFVRKNNRCEYCKVSQMGQVATFHIDHIIPVVAGGKTVVENLALACVSCSLRKGARQAIPDPQSQQMTLIFNPRQQLWREHFAWRELHIIGLTATGRATIKALNLNRPKMLAIRAQEILNIAGSPSPLDSLSEAENPTVE
jgi:hypothetical protein